MKSHFCIQDPSWINMEWNNQKTYLLHVCKISQLVDSAAVKTKLEIVENEYLSRFCTDLFILCLSG